MDTVIGRADGKVILTLHFNTFNFMVSILLNNKTAAEASSEFCELKNKLKSNGFDFCSIIPVILTDNGGEFINISAFENDED